MNFVTQTNWFSIFVGSSIALASLTFVAIAVFILLILFEIQKIIRTIRKEITETADRVRILQEKIENPEFISEKIGRIFSVLFEKWKPSIKKRRKSKK
ncbi:MAG: hypothetical protein COU07_02795 [Candidatus Harrisonbacteria bacterium CG10_big_fil_rev_8_21_14_0_10_40_38]|uniref:Uncharacterized protein n=1 Tax=Candidatus Harrisonbacteria bacterium CG10_big_fil_rev_8_21_14_0_10_40_38 TaxID=1974583 RepID=A0A2H0URZ2_9BACT|nr:MAG: hypothetical protein COU07_02795 [Candidatus Harrisonbacteria bacterium CG10_big_fil_rev_8_21_14_0_10_40_38]